MIYSGIFEHVIPLLEQDYHVIAISTDGYDGTGQITFTTAEASAEKLEAYIRENLDGQIDMVFGESFGCATAGIGAQSVDLVRRKGAEYEKSSRKTQKGFSERRGTFV